MSGPVDGGRRVYVLASDLMDRLRAYQQDHAIISEVEATRRLLNEGLLLRDTADNILRKLEAAYEASYDYRAAAIDILGRHPLVNEVGFSHGQASFTLSNGDWGVFPPTRTAAS